MAISVSLTPRHAATDAPPDAPPPAAGSVEPAAESPGNAEGTPPVVPVVDVVAAVPDVCAGADADDPEGPPGATTEPLVLPAPFAPIAGRPALDEPAPAPTEP